MGIDQPLNYLNIKPGDKIDVSAWSKFDKNKKAETELRPENYLPSLKDALAHQAAEANLSLPDFLDEGGKIKMAGVSDLKSHEYLVNVQEETFSREAGKSLEVWRRDKERSSANLTEMALTVMLHKFLKENFIVARSSDFDDYNNGVDQVLVYKATGEVVCGFDEVIVNPSDKAETFKKTSKLEKIMAKGGANIQYGAKMQDGNLVRAEVRKVPAFYMSLSKAELVELLESLKNNPEKITPIEEKIFGQLLDSLREQVAGKNLNPDLRAKTQSALEKLHTGFNQDKLVA
ncbi:MAG: hypothetical protein WC467_01185 [Patescibacteria group bacterium]